MPKKIILILKVLCLSLVILFISCNEEDSPTGPETSTLKNEIDQIIYQHLKAGAIVGILDKRGKKLVYSYGIKSNNNYEKPDENTIFEIGSITKTFTCIILADMYLKGEFIDDTVGHYLPSGVTMPSRDGVEIRFVHLATHTSGLPRTPRDSDYPLPPGYDERDPYAAYTIEQIYDYLTNYCELDFTPGTYWQYSNTGMGLAGHIAGLVDGTSYETVLTSKIFDELGMDNSSLFLTETQKNNLALGHDFGGNIVPNWNAQDIFQGCGSIKSSLKDMFKYLEANLGLRETSLRAAMDFTHQSQLELNPELDMGLAWQIEKLDDGQTIIYHGGGTGGYDTFIGFNKSSLTGAIVLMNAKTNEAQIDVGKLVMKAVKKY